MQVFKLYNRNGIEILSGKFPAGTELCEAGKELYRRGYGIDDMTFIPGKDFIGEHARTAQGYTVRAAK